MGTHTPTRGVTGARFALGAAALLGLLSAQILDSNGASAAPDASTSASAVKQIKKLKKRVAALEQAGPTGPTGPAGGELGGSYPNPTLAEEVGLTQVNVDGPCPGNHTGTCPGKWDAESLTMTRKDGSPTEITYEAFYNGQALGYSGSNGDSMFISGSGFIQVRESSFGGLPPANTVRIFPRDVGGTTQLVVSYSDGEVDVISQDD